MSPLNECMSTVLVANRGEVALRIIRAAHDQGLRAVAVFTPADATLPYVQAADHAYPLPAGGYLDAQALIECAQRAGADVLHPGYGYLSEQPDFARAVRAAGLTWVGPPPEVLERLGDKVAARRLAAEVGAPVPPGVADAADATAFAATHGLPIAIKAAFGGGGRGLKVARTMEEIPAAVESAAREAQAAFGRSECYVERYHTAVRHVECQVLADASGTVLVIGDRDCTVQRRFQKLVEEAPAPQLSDALRAELHDISARICHAAGLIGAATVEFLLGEGGPVFLEVNPRLQVEHPVTEEVYGVDIVAEQLRIAAGLPLSIARSPHPRGHTLEFRLYAEDAAADFLPSPGTLTALDLPGGPGVRIDTGAAVGSAVSPAADALLAKVIVSGGDRAQALARARRALRECRVEGVASLLPLYRQLLDTPEFVASRVHTTWLDEAFTPAFGPAQIRRVPRRRRRTGIAGRTTHPNLVSPIPGTVVAVRAAPGSAVEAGDVLVILEAMKMENPVRAHRTGTIRAVSVQPGDTVTAGATLVEIQ